MPIPTLSTLMKTMSPRWLGYVKHCLAFGRSDEWIALTYLASKNGHIPEPWATLDDLREMVENPAIKED